MWNGQSHENKKDDKFKFESEK
jgi:hypothetical protein